MRHKAKRSEKVDKRLREKKRKESNKINMRRRWFDEQDRRHKKHLDSPYACPCGICKIKRDKNAN